MIKVTEVKHMPGVKKYVDETNKFTEFFDSKSGRYMRSGVNHSFEENATDPFMRSFPALLDIGIMGGCKAASLGLCRSGGCYQGGRLYRPDLNMSLDDYKKIIDEGKEKGLQQVALGGAGNPDEHQNFKEILKYTSAAGIVQNYTTAGCSVTDEIAELTKKHCGAVAVSWYRQDYTIEAINKFLRAGCKTSIHFVLSRDTIDEAIAALRSNSLFSEPFTDGFGDSIITEVPLEKINAVIFLMYKPVGLGKQELVLDAKKDKKKLTTFFGLLNRQHPFKIGFDSCSIPGILNFTDTVDNNSIDTCEGARFSAYVTPDMKLLPCSFDNQKEIWAVSLKNATIEKAWNSRKFESFRNSMRAACPDCPKRELCMGGCPIVNSVVLCNSEQRTKKEAKV